MIVHLTSIFIFYFSVRLCPNEFFHLPMLSMDCQLENIKISEYADTKDVIKAMSNLLRGKTLKIVGIVRYSFIVSNAGSEKRGSKV